MANREGGVILAPQLEKLGGLRTRRMGETGQPWVGGHWELGLCWVFLSLCGILS